MKQQKNVSKKWLVLTFFSSFSPPRDKTNKYGLFSHPLLCPVYQYSHAHLNVFVWEAKQDGSREWRRGLGWGKIFLQVPSGTHRRLVSQRRWRLKQTVELGMLEMKLFWKLMIMGTFAQSPVLKAEEERHLESASRTSLLFSARQAVTCSWGSVSGRLHHPWKEFSKVEHLSMRWEGRSLGSAFGEVWGRGGEAGLATSSLGGSWQP